MAEDVENSAPENELKWGENAPAWVTADFFELLKSQYRNLVWFPTSPHEVVDARACFGKSLYGMVSMLQGIYREHHWSVDGGTHYRKRECEEVVTTALEERYPSFTSFR